MPKPWLNGRCCAWAEVAARASPATPARATMNRRCLEVAMKRPPVDFASGPHHLRGADSTIVYSPILTVSAAPGKRTGRLYRALMILQVQLFHHGTYRNSFLLSIARQKSTSAAAWAGSTSAGNFS